ncbi:MAG: protease inhibitor I42 family protein [Acidobacteria bacterium]|nr:protease inhibitor I42 family protein [Acidobacteriota bacterium]
MKTKNIKFNVLPILVLVSVLFYMGIAMANENEPEKKIFLMSEGQETNITVNSTGEFILRIKSNPTTGYSWSILKIEDQNLVKFKGIKTEEPGENKSNPPMLGSPTYELISFEALNPGKLQIELKYSRPWEKDVPPIKIHKVSVKIEF